MTEAGPQCLRFGKFSMTGVLGAALQVVLFNLLMKCFHLPGVTATPIAVETVLLNNFFWHERFTWRDRGSVGPRQRAIRLWRFQATNGLVSLAGNTLLTYWLVEKLKAPALPSAVAAIAACAPINFLVADRWVFGQSGLSVPTEENPQPGSRSGRSRWVFSMAARLRNWRISS